MAQAPFKSRSRTRGFKRAASLVEGRVRNAGASRGFAVARLLTHWPEIVGAEIAASARPINVSYGKQGIGATLSVLTTGAMGPMLQMREPMIREKVNACYGYNAISRIRFTQTAPTGFAEGQAAFAPAPVEGPKAPKPEAVTASADLAQGVEDPKLREALAALGAQVLSRRR